MRLFGTKIINGGLKKYQIVIILLWDLNRKVLGILLSVQVLSLEGASIFSVTSVFAREFTCVSV